MVIVGEFWEGSGRELHSRIWTRAVFVPWRRRRRAPDRRGPRHRPYHPAIMTHVPLRRSRKPSPIQSAGISSKPALNAHSRTRPPQPLVLTPLSRTCAALSAPAKSR